MVHPVQKIKIAELKSHPLQDRLFPHLDNADVDLLAEDIQQRGLQHPIEILPDHTIVCGHRRVQAAVQLGWEEIDVIIRDDLALASDAEIESHVIADNLVRRQLTPLAQARLAWRLRELLRGGNFNQLDDDMQNDVYWHTRDRIGHLLGVSGRQANRLMTLLETPAAVQQAFDQRQISAEVGAKVARQPREVREQIAHEIEQGGNPKKVIHKYVRRVRELNEQEKTFQKLVAAIRKAGTVYKDGFSNLLILSDGGEDAVSLLRQTGALFEALAQHVEKRQEEQAAALDEKMNEVSDFLGYAAATDPD